jgi:hypothetical protein
LTAGRVQQIKRKCKQGAHWNLQTDETDALDRCWQKQALPVIPAARMHEKITQVEADLPWTLVTCEVQWFLMPAEEKLVSHKDSSDAEEGNLSNDLEMQERKLATTNDLK